MNLFPNIEKAYTREHLNARDAQRLAEFIAFGPMVFQVSRLMVKFGILERLRDGAMTLPQIAQAAGLSEYAAKVLLEASLSIGTVIIDPGKDEYHLTNVGWFLLTDMATRANIDFNHDVNYEGFFQLEEALKEGKPAGLKHFGSWPTIYEGLSSLPPKVQDSWFGFDHFYSDHSFAEALPIVFAGKPRRIMDVGGNTGRFSQQCVAYDSEVEMTIVDLPQQIGLMKEAVKEDPNASRIHGYGTNLLDPANGFPESVHPDVIWMSQFLDCFSEPQILSILQRAAKIMDGNTRLMIMETFWDRQKYEPAAFCLTMTSLYFTVMANGNSKMYHSDDFVKLIKEAGLEVETIHDGLGQGHSIMICKKK
jgi:hypothetical protein